jgi:hypothetical protein
MGFLKKITRPISRVLDKVIPNEIKPALPFLAAAAPFMAPGLMSLGGNTMLSRALISGGLNLGSQLAQEGSEGDFDALSLAMASGIGALSAPGSGANAANPVNEFGTKGVVSQQSAGDILRSKAAGMDSGITKSGLEFLGKGSDKLIGLSEGLAADGIFSKAGAKALSIPFTQGTMDLAVAEGRRLEKQQIIDDALGALDDAADDAARASAIRLAMQQYGFTEDEITETIASAGYADGGRVGFMFGSPNDPALTEYLMEKMKEKNKEDDDSEEIDMTIMDFENIQGAKDGGIMNAKRGLVDGPGGYSGDWITKKSKNWITKKDKKINLDDIVSSALDDDDDDEDNDGIQWIKKKDTSGSNKWIQKKADGGLMDLGGREMDMRGGGFIPIGKKERADDVPARLSKNEFVMTADAVRAAGGGSVNKGAKRMYDLMNNLEARV